MTTQFLRTRNTWLAYLLLGFYSYFINILGPITPFLHDEFQLSYTVSSLHFSAFAVGILVVGVAGQVVIGWLGRYRSLAVGAWGLGAGALLLVLGRTPFITVGASFLMGCVGSLILAIVPVVLSEEHGEQRAIAISEANFLASMIATAAPLLVGWLAHLMIGWRPALFVVGLGSILAGLVLFRTRQARVARVEADGPQGRLPLRFWFYWTLLMLGIAVEFCIIYWGADYMEEELHLATASAAQAVSLFLGGMILGRLVASRVLRVLSARSFVLVSISLALLGFLVYWSTAIPLVGMVSLLVTGVGVGSLYPLLLSIALGAANGSQAQAGARTTLASGTAILALPLVLGRLADLSSLKAAFGVIPVLLGTMLVMMLITTFTARMQKKTEDQPQPVRS